MHANVYFKKGKAHVVCEDYGLAARSETPDGEDVPIVAVSDGCSSSTYTDVGARLLCWSAASLLHEQATSNLLWGERDSAEVLHRANDNRPFGLPFTALDCTLGTLHWDTDTKVVKGEFHGDGFFATLDHDDNIHVYEVRHLPGQDGRIAPWYLSYLADADRLRTYFDEGHGHWEGRQWMVGDEDSLQVTKYQTELTEEDDKLSVEPEASPAGAFSPDKYKMVAIFSDGLATFRRKDMTGRYCPIPVDEVLQQVMKIKHAKGKFVERRCRAFFERFCIRNGWEHSDDFTMGAIWLGEKE